MDSRFWSTDNGLSPDTLGPLLRARETVRPRRVAEASSAARGSSADPLMAAAKEHADGLGCPVATDRAQAMGPRTTGTKRPRWQGEPGDRFGGMLGR